MAYIDTKYLGKCETCRHCIGEYKCNTHCDSGECYSPNMFKIPTADVVEVRHDFNVGDFCLYGYVDGNKSLAVVEIVKILDDERGIAELKFHKVIKDNTGNGYFHYLLKSGHTMNGSFEYLKNITPIVDGERKEQ